MHQIFRKKDCDLFKPDNTTTITNYVTKDNSPELSIVMSEIDGDHGEFIYHGGIQFYVVVEGTVEFIFESTKIILHVGDVIKIFNEWHRKIGTKAKMIVISYPAFDQNKEETR